MPCAWDPGLDWIGGDWRGLDWRGLDYIRLVQGEGERLAELS